MYDQCSIYTTDTYQVAYIFYYNNNNNNVYVVFVINLTFLLFKIPTLYYYYRKLFSFRNASLHRHVQSGKRWVRFTRKKSSECMYIRTVLCYGRVKYMFIYLRCNLEGKCDEFLSQPVYTPIYNNNIIIIKRYIQCPVAFVFTVCRNY